MYCKGVEVSAIFIAKVPNVAFAREVHWRKKKTGMTSMLQLVVRGFN